MTINEFADGIRILSTYVSGYALGSGHDVVYVYGVPNTMPQPIIDLLDKLGWEQQIIDEDNTSTWIAYL